jgi:transcriptional regulator with XRE-family HTH domain
MQTIGDRIRAVRRERKLTQGELGKKSGCSTSTISDLENGHMAETTYIVSIAQSLNVSPSWLESGKGDRLPSAVNRVEEPRSILCHGHTLTPEAAALGAEWMKLDAGVRDAIAIAIECMVAKQIRTAREAKKTGKRGDLSHPLTNKATLRQ